MIQSSVEDRLRRYLILVMLRKSVEIYDAVLILLINPASRGFWNRHRVGGGAFKAPPPEKAYLGTILTRCYDRHPHRSIH